MDIVQYIVFFPVILGISALAYMIWRVFEAVRIGSGFRETTAARKRQDLGLTDKQLGAFARRLASTPVSAVFTDRGSHTTETSGLYFELYREK